MQCTFPYGVLCDRVHPQYDISVRPAMILRGGEARPSKREAKKKSRSQETGDVSGVDRWTVGPSSAQMV